MKKADRIDSPWSVEGADLIIRTNLDGLITFMSASAERLTGYKREDFLGRSISDLVGVETAAKLGEAVKDRIRHPERRTSGLEYSFVHKDGHTVWFEARPSPLIDAITGRQIGVTDVVRDITESRAAREALEFANVLLQVQMEASPSAILVVNDQLRIVSYNEKFCRMWSVPPFDPTADNNSTVVTAVSGQVKDSEALSGRLDWLSANTDEESRGEVEIKDGRLIEVCTVPMRSKGRPILGRAYFFQDVTEQRRALTQALRQARFDNLTKLVNRGVFVDAVKTAIAAAKRGARGFALIFLDLDRFKAVNDTLGHPAGDELLVQVAARLKNNLREVDLVSRFGGDEFAVIIADVETRAPVDAIAAKLVAVLSAPYHIQDRVVFSSASLGIEMYGPDALDVETLLLNADVALYRAKANKPGSYSFFAEEQTDAPEGASNSASGAIARARSAAPYTEVNASSFANNLNEGSSSSGAADRRQRS